MNGKNGQIDVIQTQHSQFSNWVELNCSAYTHTHTQAHEYTIAIWQDVNHLHVLVCHLFTTETRKLILYCHLWLHHRIIEQPEGKTEQQHKRNIMSQNRNVMIAFNRIKKITTTTFPSFMIIVNNRLEIVRGVLFL